MEVDEREFAIDHPVILMTAYNVKEKVKCFSLTLTLCKGKKKKKSLKGLRVWRKMRGSNIIITVIIILAEWKIELWVSQTKRVYVETERKQTQVAVRE